MLDQGQDVWGQTREVNMTSPKQTTQPQVRGARQTAQGAFASNAGQPGGQGTPSTSGAGPGSATMPAAAIFALENIQ